MVDNIKKKIEEIIIQDSFLVALKIKTKKINEQKVAAKKLDNKFYEYLSGNSYLHKGRYYAESKIRVRVGSKLTIEDGVTILFDEKCGLESHGTLQYMGTEDNPIIFALMNKHWSGMDIPNSKQPYDSIFNEFLYCGIVGVVGNPALSITKQKISISN